MVDPIRVLTCDDHHLVRDGLRENLGDVPDIKLVAETSDGAQAVQRAHSLKPDVVVMDLQLPVISGKEVIRAIKADLPNTNILALSAYENHADVLDAVRNGAIGFVSKDDSREQLLEAIRKAARGESYLSTSASSSLVHQLQHPAQEVLSPYEIEVLQLAARGMTNAQIAAQLFVSEATVRNRLRDAFQKLGTNDRTAAVARAMHRGFLSLGP